MNTSEIKTPRIATNKPELERTWKIKSDSDASVTYYLRLVNGRWICSCPDTRYNKNPECKHVRRVLAEIEAMRDAKLQKEATQVAEEATLKARLLEMEQQLAELRSQVAQLAASQTIQIKAESIVIDAPMMSRRSSAKGAPATIAEEPKITEIIKGDKLIACELDGYRLPIIREEFAAGCTCGNDRLCKHGEALDKYLAKRQIVASAFKAKPEPKKYDPLALPLNGNRPFSIMH